MRRTLKHAFIKPLLLPAELDLASGTPALDIGKQDFGTMTDNADGDTTLPVALPFARAALAFASLNSAASDGGYCNLQAVGTASQIRLQQRDEGGTLEDSDADLVVLGYESAETEAVISQAVKSTRHSMEVLALQFDGTDTTPAIDIGGTEVATLTDNGTGDYTLKLENALGALPIILATAVDGTNVRALKVTSKSRQEFTIKSFDDSQVAQDAKINILLFGSMSRDETHGMRRSIKARQRKPRMVAGSLTVAAGAGTASVNAKDFAVTDPAGAGEFTVTYTNAFAREPVVVLLAVGDARAQLKSSSSTAFTAQCMDAGGSDAEPTALNFLAIGFDDATQY